MDATSIEEIQTFLEEAVKDSCEGLMVKMLSGEGSSYEPSKRSMNWLKVPHPHPHPHNTLSSICSFFDGS
jgi:ATP-dependent DNA ligase